MLRRHRLDARPTPVAASAPTGLLPLELSGQRDSYLYVAAGYEPGRPSPLVLFLHGSGGHAHHGLDLLQPLADELGAVLVAPASSDYSWDLMVSRYAADVAIVNRALEQVFASYAVDAAHVAIAGFSDGASYALSLGLANTELFTHVIAFSPGFVLLPEAGGSPRIFLSHGARDEIRPISSCSHRILTQLERRGLTAEYVEFEGGHRIPAEVARAALEWFTESAGSEHAPGRSRDRESRPPRGD